MTQAGADSSDRQWLVITGHWQPGSCVTRCHHHQQQAALGVVTGEAGEEGRGQVASHDSGDGGDGDDDSDD